MEIDADELTRRLAEADRARRALRRATRELAAAGARLLERNILAAADP